jgi:hypothetical protein
VTKAAIRAGSPWRPEGDRLETSSGMMTAATDGAAAGTGSVTGTGGVTARRSRSS